MFLDLLLLITSSGSNSDSGHHTSCPGIGSSGAFIDGAVSHGHHALPYIPLRVNKDYVKLEESIDRYVSRWKANEKEMELTNTAMKLPLEKTSTLLLRSQIN